MQAMSEPVTDLIIQIINDHTKGFRHLNEPAEQVDKETLMVITVLEARVAAEKSSALEAAYNDSIKQLDAGIEQTFLVRNFKEPARWQIITVWESLAALEAMRNSGQTPRGVIMFHAADAEPTLSIWDAVAHAGAAA